MSHRMADAEVVLEVVQQPPPPPPPLPVVLVVVNVVQCLYLASWWVACAGVAASTVARRALGDASPMADTFLKVSIGALVFAALFILVAATQLLRVMCALGFRSSLRASAREVQIQSRKAFGALTWRVLLDPAVLGWLASVFFLLLCGAAGLVLAGLFPTEESQRERIGYALFDAGILGVMAMNCFIIIPSVVLKVWRSK